VDRSALGTELIKTSGGRSCPGTGSANARWCEGRGGAHASPVERTVTEGCAWCESRCGHCVVRCTNGRGPGSTIRPKSTWRTRTSLRAEQRKTSPGRSVRGSACAPTLCAVTKIEAGGRRPEIELLAKQEMAFGAAVIPDRHAGEGEMHAIAGSAAFDELDHAMRRRHRASDLANGRWIPRRQAGRERCVLGQLHGLIPSIAARI
jgi:hypothetical protein